MVQIKTDREKNRKYLKIGIISFFALFVIGYGLYEAQRIVTGPEIALAYPLNGATVSESLMSVSGVAKNITDISLNDKKIFVDEKGNFNEQLLLSYGYNVLSVKAQDKFGRSTEKKVEVIYK